MINKLTWIYRLLRSRSYMIILDKESMVSIPVMDINKLENQFLLGAQTASLMEFKVRLEDVIREHEEAIRLLSHRKSVKKASKK